MHTDWEAIADRAPDELLSPQHLPEVSKISLQDSKVQAPKRRGRGTFSYQKHSLYSDQQSDEPAVDDIEDETVSGTPEGSSDTNNCMTAFFSSMALFDHQLLSCH